MIKYGISQEDVEELVKLGVCHDEEEARELVSQGKAASLIKMARDSRKKKLPEQPKKEK